MASGQVSRANRPNTWLHRPALQREKTLANREPSTHGTSRTWRDAVWRSAFRGKADYKVTLPKRLLMTQFRPLRVTIATPIRHLITRVSRRVYRTNKKVKCRGFSCSEKVIKQFLILVNKI